MKHFAIPLMSVPVLSLALSLLPCKLYAQATPEATRAGALQAGGTISFLHPDTTGYLSGTNVPESATWTIGGSIYGTFDLTQHIGVTAEVNYPTAHTPNDFLEKTYLFGIRYVLRYGRYEPYAKVLIGVGNTSYDLPVQWITFPGTPQTSTVIAYGGGLDYIFSRHFNLRPIDFEVQHWSGYTGGAINPYMISVGAAYRFR